MQAVPQHEATRAHADVHVRSLLADRIVVTGGFVGATRKGVATTLGREGRITPPPSSARRSTPRRSRSGPTWTACSPPIRAWSPIRSSCRACRSARLQSSRFRRQGPAPEDHSAGRGEEHPRPHPQHVPPDAPVLDRRPCRRGALVGDGARLQEGHHRHHHHVHRHADGARLHAPAVRGLRAAPHLGGRRLDLRGQRLGDRRRGDAPREHRGGPVGVRGGERGRDLALVAVVGDRMGPIRPRFAGWSAPWRASRSGWCRRRTPGAT